MVACKELETYGIIKVKYHGMPKKRYFKFNTSMLNKLYEDFQLNSNVSEDDILEEDNYIKGSELTLPRRKFEGFSF